MVDVEAGDTYLSTVQDRDRREAARRVGPRPSPTAKAALQRGQVATQDWLKDHSITIDPIFGISADGGQFKAAPDQTSYPLSTLASQGAAAGGASQPDPAYTTALAAVAGLRLTMAPGRASRCSTSSPT